MGIGITGQVLIVGQHYQKIISLRESFRRGLSVVFCEMWQLAELGQLFPMSLTDSKSQCRLLVPECKTKFSLFFSWQCFQQLIQLNAASSTQTAYFPAYHVWSCTQASDDRLSDQYLTLSFILLASYEPVGETCHDFYSLGMYPEIHNGCLQFLNTKNQHLNCCWNNTDSDSVRPIFQTIIIFPDSVR